jgi:hypothetical protein
MSGDVRTLALAYSFTEEEKYAAKAAEMLRVWFLKESQRMNPNMKYSGFQPGRSHDKGNGLIDARYLTRVIDAVGLLGNSKSWTRADQKGITGWYGKFLNWLLTSELGKQEANAKNNHQTRSFLPSLSVQALTNTSSWAPDTPWASWRRWDGSW